MFMFNLLYSMRLEEVRNRKKYDHTTYGVLVFNEKMEVVECNYMIQELLGKQVEDNSCEGEFLPDVLSNINNHSAQNNINLKAVMVLSANCATKFNAYHIPSDKLTTIIDQTGTVIGGTIIIRNRSK